MSMKRFISAVIVLAFAAGSAVAAPCNTGAAKPKSPDQKASNMKSSDPDHSSKNLAGGAQPASPGTVGAMNNVGAAQTTGQQAANQGDKSGSTDPAAKNLAGGQQPASPGTVGAMNNAAAGQTTGMKDDGC